MKRTIRFPQRIVCLDCGKKVVGSFAKAGICPSCSITKQGLNLDISVKQGPLETQERRTPLHIS
jgi:hypothetical protein